MSKKILFIGPAPGAATKDRAFSGFSGNRLAKLSLMTKEEFLNRVDTINLCEEKFNLSEAKGTIKTLDLSLYDFVVLVGKEVARAFSDVFYLYGFSTVPLFNWVSVEYNYRMYTNFAVVLHPSGLNREMNKLENIAKYVLFLNQLFLKEEKESKR